MDPRLGRCVLLVLSVLPSVVVVVLLLVALLVVELVVVVLLVLVVLVSHSRSLLLPREAVAPSH